MKQIYLLRIGGRFIHPALALLLRINKPILNGEQTSPMELPKYLT
jgi:hypothetical protein